MCLLGATGKLASMGGSRGLSGISAQLLYLTILCKSMNNHSVAFSKSQLV